MSNDRGLFFSVWQAILPTSLELWQSQSWDAVALWHWPGAATVRVAESLETLHACSLSTMPRVSWTLLVPWAHWWVHICAYVCVYETWVLSLTDGMLSQKGLAWMLLLADYCIVWADGESRGISMDVVRWLDTVIGWLGVIIGWLDVNTGWLIVLCVQAESVDLGVAVVIEWLDRVTGWLSDVVIGWLDVMNDSWTDCIFFCRRRVRRVGCGCCQNHACMTWFNTSLLYSTMTTCGLPAMLPWF